MNFFSSIFSSRFVFLALLILVISGCQENNKPRIVLSFDTEYPIGIGFPENFTEEQKREFIPSELEWIQGIKEISGIGIKNRVRFQFNVVGITAEKYPNIIKELSGNHDISCHTYGHKDQLKIDYNEKVDELKNCKKAVENVTGREIKGNRFPYTRQNNESFIALNKAGYEWDSSLWRGKIELVPLEFNGVKEYPINPASEDWYYFINQQKKDAEAFFRLFDEEIDKLNKNSTYILVLHPWVLAKDKEKIRALEGFVLRHRREIVSIDEIYSKIK